MNRLGVGLLLVAIGGGASPPASSAEDEAGVVDATTVRGKVLCGYQGWFRCPGDPSGMGWVHWSRDQHRIAPGTLTFDMWPDMTEFGPAERFAAPGFTDSDGRPASLFSSDNAETVARHFRWMRDAGIEGVWLQHFLVDLPGGLSNERIESRRRVLDLVRKAARDTGRAWALSFDISGMPPDRIVEVLTDEWKRLEAAGIPADARYIHEKGRPVVQVWGFYRNQAHNPMTPEIARRLIAFFAADGPHPAFLIGGGAWDWRKDQDPEWRGPGSARRLFPLEYRERFDRFPGSQARHNQLLGRG